MRCGRIPQMILAVPLAGLFLLGVATPATATPPDREPVDLPPGTSFTFTDTLGGNPCGFEVQLLVVANNEVVTTFAQRAGTTSIHVTGTLKVRLTTDAGQSVDLNISGPTHLTNNADGSVTQIALGRALWVFDPGVGPGLPRLAVISGRTVSTFDPGFTLVSVSGHVEDMCSALAGA
jgi:hypothetical protein